MFGKLFQMCPDYVCDVFGEAVVLWLKLIFQVLGVILSGRTLVLWHFVVTGSKTSRGKI